MRSTTENVAGIAATAKALRLAMGKPRSFCQQDPADERSHPTRIGQLSRCHYLFW